MKKLADEAKPSRSYVISLDNRKARGSGHERPEEILAAARELFLEHGIEGVSTRQIATRVGISQTAVYVYFKNKGEMLDRLSEGAFRKLGEAMREVEGRHADPVEFLRAWIPEYVRFGIRHPDEYRLAFVLRDGRRQGAMLPMEQRQTEGLQVFKMFQGHIAAAQASGGLRGAAAASSLAVAQALWAAMHGLVALLLAYSDFGWVAFDELLRVHTDMLLNGLLAPPHPGDACNADLGNADLGSAAAARVSPTAKAEPPPHPGAARPKRSGDAAPAA